MIMVYGSDERVWCPESHGVLGIFGSFTRGPGMNDVVVGWIFDV
jgi:hypothetical protein